MNTIDTHLLEKSDLKKLTKILGVRPDWHEPDESDITIKFVDGTFDNAYHNDNECHIIIYKDKVEQARVNMASLLGWASS